MNYINIKQCTLCNTVKPIMEFYKQDAGRFGVNSRCKACAIKQSNDLSKKRNKTKKGLISKMYGSQQARSREKQYPQPGYTLSELRSWLISQLLFHGLYDKWVESGYQRMTIPSCDRLDDDRPYTLDNIRLTTWAKNKAKGERDRRNGINNKASIPVIQMDINNKVISEYYSAMQAMRETGICQSNISSCCKDKRKTAGGFNWQYTVSKQTNAI